MSQISPPIRIVLAVAVIFMAAWMTVLKPKTTEDIGTAPAGNVAAGDPAVSAPGKVAEAVKGAIAPSAAKSDTAAGTQTGTAKAGSTAAKADEVTGVPKPIARAIAKRQVVAILFHNGTSADDRAVRSAFRKADRWSGRAYFASAPIDRVSRYSPITRGVDVNQSPTVVVIDRDRNATPLVGYVDTRSIDQAVVDALRNSGPLFTSAYLRKVNDVCMNASSSMFAVPSAQTLAETPSVAKRHSARMSAFAADLRSIPAPARFRAFKKASVADATALSGIYSTWAASIAKDHGAKNVVNATGTAQLAMSPVTKRFNARMDKNHVLSCGTNG